MPMGQTSGVQRHKIVVNMFDGTVVKGYFETAVPTDLGALLENPNRSFPSILPLQRPEGGDTFEVDLSKAKAVFFVKRFEGNSEKHAVRFYAQGPAVHGIWVEVKFKDGEVIEGVISNSINHLVDEGFLMSPTDPDGNNELIYVLKSAITNYRVLGVRTVR